jgi:hypothetical protein
MPNHCVTFRDHLNQQLNPTRTLSTMHSPPLKITQRAKTLHIFAHNDKSMTATAQLTAIYKRSRANHSGHGFRLVINPQDMVGFNLSLATHNCTLGIPSPTWSKGGRGEVRVVKHPDQSCCLVFYGTVYCTSHAGPRPHGNSKQAQS